MGTFIPATTSVKPGYKTTEFWTTLATQAMGFLGMVGALPLPPQIKGTAVVAGAVLSAVTSAGYAISRAITKSKATGTPDVTVKP